MIILGIETSCDETAAAVVENGTKVLSSVVSSSEEIHKKYGGIVPEQAAREQIKCIIPVIQEAIKNSKLKIQIDAIAVTYGPGLIGSLLIGVETAKTLSLVWNKPIIPINHLIAHIYANFIGGIPNSEIAPPAKPLATLGRNPKFPALCLIVSGGHTELVLMKNHNQFKWLGGTRDDAAGECFDKCARILDLDYPGGPEIEKVAKQISKKTTKQFDNLTIEQFRLPRPMIKEDNLDFSFSGLKTSLLRKAENLKSQNLPYSIRGRGSFMVNLLAKEVQEAITDVLVTKTLKAAEKYKVKSILVGGGVAANQRLREKFQSAINDLSANSQGQQSTINLFIPEKKLCTDNAAAIAAAAFFSYKPVHWSKIKPNPSLEII